MLIDIDERTWDEKRKLFPSPEVEYKSFMDKRSPVGHYFMEMVSEDGQYDEQALCHAMLRANNKGVVCSFKSVDVHPVNGKPEYGAIMVEHMLKRLLDRHPEVYVVQVVCKAGETQMVPYFVANGFQLIAENGSWVSYGKNV